MAKGTLRIRVTEIGEDGEDITNTEVFESLPDVSRYLLGTQFYRDPNLRIEVLSTINPSGTQVDVTLQAMALTLYLEKGIQRIEEASISRTEEWKLKRELVDAGITY